AGAGEPGASGTQGETIGVVASASKRGRTMSRAEVRKMTPAPVRIAYFNGRFLPEFEVRVPFRDRGFKYGDAVFDTTRTFGHRVFKLAEHVERLYRSLRYLRIDPGVTQDAMIEITGEVVRRNLPLLEPDEDYWVTQRVSLRLDTSGNLAEGLGSNIFLVQKGHLLTPREQAVLSGISRETVIDLARDSGLEVVEKDIDLYDAYNADEAFLTSTSLCICPIVSVNGAKIGNAVPGAVTRQLTEAYCRFVD